ncbi:unnamed protein product [Callosobruchus maculatus]|uniref:Myb-like domain-containing protein n=2 Tax=Callosobruchus maculatus TaxID=64391 RepID=A0A653C7X4_CALMS|nr:unnamed protein product [Callosobruchus maculatus]
MAEYNIIMINGSWGTDAEGNILIREKDSGNTLAIEQGMIGFTENNRPFIKDTEIVLGYETQDCTSSSCSQQGPVLHDSEQQSVLESSEQHSALESSTNWQHHETLALISAVEERYEDLYHPKKRRTFWDVISETLSGDRINFDGKKCKKKWENLVRTYKNTKDKKNKSGRCPVRFVYFERMDELLGDKPSNCSPHTFDVGASTSRQTQEPEAPALADQSLENVARQENIETRKKPKRNISLQYVEVKKTYYDRKATAYEEYTRKKLEIMERKVILEERKVKALEAMAANNSKHK